MAQWKGQMLTLSNFMRGLRIVADDGTNDPQSCACLSAVCYNRVEELLRSEPGLVPELEDTFWRETLVYLARIDRWSCVQTLLARGTGRVCWKLFGRKAFWAFQDHPAAVAVFDMMAARCLELQCSCIKDYVRFVTWAGLVDRLKNVVYSENTAVRQFVLDNVVNLVFNSTIHRKCLAPRPGSDFNGCLTMACEAGLFTARLMGQSSLQDSAHDTAMRWAVLSNQPGLVRFLYHAGATSNRNLFQLSCDPYLKAKAKAGPANVPQLPTANDDYPTLDDVDAAKNIQGFLTRVASTPRSLDTLCLLQVSRHLGWGHGRESRIEQLKIPHSLKEDLKFKDHKAFLKYPSQK